MKAVEAPLISTAQHTPAALRRHSAPPPYKERRRNPRFLYLYNRKFLLLISLLLLLIATLLTIGLSFFFYPNLYGVKSEAFLPKGLFARPIRQYNETNWFSHVYQDVHWEPSQGKVDELRPVLPKGHEKVELPGRVVIPCNENCTTGGDVVECCRTHQWNDGVCIEEEQRDGRIERQAVCWQGDGLRIYSRDNPRPQHPATTNASAEDVNAENAGMPAATEAAMEYIREVAFQGVLKPVRREHRAAVTKWIQCEAANQGRPEEQVIKDILEYTTSNSTVGPFISALHYPECATLTDDEYVRALGKWIRITSNNAEKVIKAFPQFEFLDDIADMIAERYLNYTNGRYGTEIPCDLFEMMGKENIDAMNYYVAFFLIGEEVIPGSVFKYIDPRKYVNPKLFEESEEKIELKDLIVCEDKKESVYDEVLRPVSKKHRAGVKEWIQCVAAMENRAEGQVIEEILEYRLSNATAGPFISVLNPECVTRTDDEYVRALGKWIRIAWNNDEKVRKAFPQFESMDDIADMIAERYLNYTNGRYGMDIPCDLFEMMGKENIDAMNYYVAFFLIGEEVVPGSVFKSIDPRKYINPKLFEKSEEKIELKDLIVKCGNGSQSSTTPASSTVKEIPEHAYSASTARALVSVNKKQIVFDKVLRPVSKKHRAAVKEWIQCAAAKKNRAEEQVIEEILKKRRSNATAGPFISVLNSECAIQADDEYVRALGKWTSIYRSNSKKIKKAFAVKTVVVGEIADMIAEHYLNYTHGRYGKDIPCDLFEIKGKENSDVMKHFVTLILIGEELKPGSAFQSIDPRKYVNPKLFEKSEEKIEMKDLIVRCDKKESMFDEVLSPVSKKHRAAVKEWIQCAAAKKNRAEEQVIEEILKKRRSNATAGPFISVLNSECAIHADDEYVRALGKWTNIDKSGFEKIKKAFAVKTKNVPFREIADKIAEHYLKYTNGRYGTEIPCNLFEMMGKENSDVIMRYVTLILIGEELIPGSAFKSIDPRKYVNPKLFEKSEEKIEMKDLIVKCGNGRALVSVNKKQSVFDKVLSPVSKKHRTAVREWIQCVGRRNNRTDEETVARILANKQANWTVGPFFDEFIAEDEECALQSDDKYVVALGKLATIYNRNVDVVKRGLSVINRTNLDQSSIIHGNKLSFPRGLNVSCKNWVDSREEDIKDFTRLSFAYAVVGKELLPDGVFQPAQWGLNEDLFERNSDIKISKVYGPCKEKRRKKYPEAAKAEKKP